MRKMHRVIPEELRNQLGRISIPLSVLRVQHGKISQEKLAEATKISQRTISALETGKQRRIDLETISKLCEFFQCPTDELIEVLFIREERHSDDPNDLNLNINVFRPPPSRLAGQPGVMGDSQTITVRFSPELVQSWGESPDEDAQWGFSPPERDKHWYGHRAVWALDGAEAFLRTHERLPQQGFSFTLQNGPTRDEIDSIPPERERVLEKFFK